jgi:hypothetical protein
VTKSERSSVLIRLWLQRPADKRTADDVLSFHAVMEQEHPDLLSPRRAADNRYQELHSILRSHIRRSP